MLASILSVFGRGGSNEPYDPSRYLNNQEAFGGDNIGGENFEFEGEGGNLAGGGNASALSALGGADSVVDSAVAVANAANHRMMLSSSAPTAHVVAPAHAPAHALVHTPALVPVSTANAAFASSSSVALVPFRSIAANNSPAALLQDPSSLSQSSVSPPSLPSSFPPSSSSPWRLAAPAPLPYEGTITDATGTYDVWRTAPPPVPDRDYRAHLSVDRTPPEYLVDRFTQGAGVIEMKHLARDPVYDVAAVQNSLRQREEDVAHDAIKLNWDGVHKETQRLKGSDPEFWCREENRVEPFLPAQKGVVATLPQMGPDPTTVWGARAESRHAGPAGRTQVFLPEYDEVLEETPRAAAVVGDTSAAAQAPQRPTVAALEDDSLRPDKAARLAQPALVPSARLGRPSRVRHPTYLKVGGGAGGVGGGGGAGGAAGGAGDVGGGDLRLSLVRRNVTAAGPDMELYPEGGLRRTQPIGARRHVADFADTVHPVDRLGTSEGWTTPARVDVVATAHDRNTPQSRARINEAPRVPDVATLDDWGGGRNHSNFGNIGHNGNSEEGDFGQTSRATRLQARREPVRERTARSENKLSGLATGLRIADVPDVEGGAGGARRTPVQLDPTVRVERRLTSSAALDAVEREKQAHPHQSSEQAVLVDGGAAVRATGGRFVSVADHALRAGVGLRNTRGARKWVGSGASEGDAGDIFAEQRPREPVPDDVAAVIGSEARVAEALHGSLRGRTVRLESARAEQRAADMYAADTDSAYVDSGSARLGARDSRDSLGARGALGAHGARSSFGARRPDWVPEDGPLKARRKAGRDDGQRADIATRPHRYVEASGGTLYPSAGIVDASRREDASLLPVKRNGALGASLDRPGEKPGARRDWDPEAVERMEAENSHKRPKTTAIERLATTQRNDLWHLAQQTRSAPREDPDADDRPDREPTNAPIRELRETRLSRMADTRATASRPSIGAPGRAPPERAEDRLPARPFVHTTVARRQGQGAPLDLSKHRAPVNRKEDTSSAAARRAVVRLRTSKPGLAEAGSVHTMLVPDQDPNEQRLRERDAADRRFAAQQREDVNSAAARRAEMHEAQVEHSARPLRPDHRLPTADDEPRRLSSRLSTRTFERTGGKHARGGFVSIHA